jgi:ubiquitin carboxyl-terminal hydrolase 4/11/15
LTERATSTKKKTATYFKWSRSSTPEPRELLNGKKQLITSEDTIVCEWDPNMLDFFFGIVPSKGYKKEENSSWEQWETFEHPDYVSAMMARKKIKECGMVLEDCFDEFTKEGHLGENNLWYCHQCKKDQQATKKTELWKLPDILILHLQRFGNNKSLMHKIDTFVKFPTQDLDLGEWVRERLVMDRLIKEGNELISPQAAREPLLYDLYAVNEHLGSLDGGHYQAYARNFQDDNWYHFDDDNVKRSTAEAAVVCLHFKSISFH